MAITHAGLSIPGTHEEPQFGAWDRPVQRTHVFGLDGATELSGGRHSRPFSIGIWVHSNYSFSNLLGKLGEIEQHAGEIGTLVTTAAVTRNIANVLFDRLEIVSGRGAIPSPALGWFADCRLHFVQMSPE
jgi:hypothetical protein